MPLNNYSMPVRQRVHLIILCSFLVLKGDHSLLSAFGIKSKFFPWLNSPTPHCLLALFPAHPHPSRLAVFLPSLRQPIFQPQGFCTCPSLCLECSSPSLYRACSTPPFRSQFKYFFNKSSLAINPKYHTVTLYHISFKMVCIWLTTG